MRAGYAKQKINLFWPYIHLSDGSKYKKLKQDPTLLREGQLQRFLLTLKKNNFFNKEQYDYIYPTGSQPSRLYGLPKMHKIVNEGDIPSF